MTPPTHPELQGSDWKKTNRWHIAVLVPARNEEELLPRCLASIHNARRQLGELATTDIIVVSDCSTDSTYELATKALGVTGLALSADLGNVGAARRFAAEAALRRAPAKVERCWLVNTDADCVVPASWLLDQLAFAEAGYHAVAGVVDVDCFAEHSAAVPLRFRESYHIYDDGTHPHVHGANLGVRADAYLAAGGWCPAETAEDHDLWRRLSEGHWTRRADAASTVLTSGRRVGRAPYGFAGALAAHNQEPSS